MKAFVTCLLILAIGIGGITSVHAGVLGGWSQPVDLSPERDYRIFPDINDNATRVVFLDFNQYDLPAPQDNIRKIKVVEYQDGAWGNEILIGSNGHYVADSTFEWMPKTTRPVISGDGNTIAYMGYTGVEAHPYAIYFSNRSPSGVWSEPAVLPEGVMTTHYGELSLSHDGNTLIHTSDPDLFSGEWVNPYISTRQAGVWGNPLLVYDGLYGSAFNVVLSADGNRAAFVATYNLYLLEKTGGGWGVAVKVVGYDPLTSLRVEYPQFTADGKSLFYWEVYCPPIPGGCVLTNQNLKRIHDNGSSWSAPSQVAFSDTPGWGKDGNSPAAIDATGQRVVFPVAGRLADDIMYSTNLVYTDWRDGAWTEPVLITSASDYNYYKQPVLSADGSRLVYTGPSANGLKSTTILLSTNTYQIYLPLVIR